jgi:anti-sigma-K factor RskA
VSARENNGFTSNALPDDSHDRIRELCALSTTGELTEEEWASLREHLAGCSRCRDLMTQYAHVVATSTHPIAPESIGSPGEENEPDSWWLERAEERLMAVLRQESRTPLPSRASTPTRRLFWRYVAAASILTAVGGVCYIAGHLRRHGMEPLSLSSSSTGGISSPFGLREIHAAKPQSRPERSEPGDSGGERNQVQQAQKQIARLEDKLDLVTNELANQGVALNQSVEERDELGRELTEAQQKEERLESRLSTTGNQVSEDTAQMLGLRTQIEDLNRTLTDKDKEIAETQQLLQHDKDIRNLIGARHLYIAEIYDVGRAGDTEKPFGRIFYTKDKSLIFYGYDLDQQRGVKKDASFQAWGRRSSDRKPDVSLGLFYEEDAGNKRWILKFADPAMLEQLDAVFITVEPTGGSPKPTGKPLLFTYLRIDPNHP